MTDRTSVLHSLTRTTGAGHVRLAGTWDVPGQSPAEVWFEVEGPAEDLDRISLNANAFLVALLVPAMERGTDLRVDRAVTPELLFQINESVVPLLASMLPELTPVRVSAAEAAAPLPREGRSGASTGMSCGIDSFTTLIANRRAEVPEAQRISRLVFHDVGAAGQLNEFTDLFNHRFARSEQVAKSEGLPILKIRSNLTTLFRTGFVKTHTVRNASAAFVLQDLVESYLYSSTFAYSGIHGGTTWDSATADPILLPALSTRDFALISSNSAMSRLDKTLAYMATPIHLEHLDICTESDPGAFQNCGRCGKCGRFLLIAEAEGTIGTYAEIFDIARFRASRWKNVRQLTKLAHHRKYNPNDRDHLVYLRDKGADLPLSARAAGRLSAAWSRLR